MYSPETSEYTIKEEIFDNEYIPSKLEYVDAVDEKIEPVTSELNGLAVDMDNFGDLEDTGRLDIDLKEETKPPIKLSYNARDNYEDYVNQENDDGDEDDDNNRDGEEFDGFNNNDGGGRPERMMNDIFGDSDEEEDFEGFNANEVDKNEAEKVAGSERAAAVAVQEEDRRRVVELRESGNRYEADCAPLEAGSDILRCFEDVVAKQRTEKRLNRPKKRTDVEFLNDMDDRIADLMNKMRLAAVEDEELYHMGQPGIKKIQLLPAVKDILNRSNIKEALIESKFLVVMAAWLKPLPNHILPPLDIRIVMLKALLEFPTLSSDVMRESNIGKAVMYLCKHPKETIENKKIAAYLINEWSRPIFHLSSNYDGMTREERLERDRAIGPRRRLVDSDAKKESMDDSEKATKPGEEGWIPRATVPKPSNKDYIIRPGWRVDDVKRSFDDGDDDDDDEDGRGGSRGMRPPNKKRSRNSQGHGGGGANNPANWEKTFRKIREAGKQRKMIQRAANISIQGRGLGI